MCDRVKWSCAVGDEPGEAMFYHDLAKCVDHKFCTLVSGISSGCAYALEASTIAAAGTHGPAGFEHGSNTARGQRQIKDRVLDDKLEVSILVLEDLGMDITYVPYRLTKMEHLSGADKYYFP